MINSGRLAQPPEKGSVFFDAVCRRLSEINGSSVRHSAKPNLYRIKGSPAHALLILTILTMVFVSLYPYALKKIGLLILGLICLASVSCFG